MRGLYGLALVAMMTQVASAADKTIVQTAAGNSQFSTLVAAVKAAGLADTLGSKGPFTVFAPTNDAFARLPEGTVEALLKPENKEKLAAILTYHVVPSKVLAADVVKLNGKAVKTAQGGTVMIGKSKVVKTDIECSNGVIHVIDTVLLPPSR